MHKKKIGLYIFLWTFIIICFGSKFIWCFVGPYIDAENHENREKATRPTLDADNYFTFADEYESYFDDNLQFRGNLVTLNSIIDYYIFDKSSNNEVIKGKDGWLFYSYTQEDYQKNNLYTQEELEEIKNDVLMTEEYFDQLGIEFIIFIGPNKNSVYGEYMPEYISVEEQESRVDQMVQYLKENTDVSIIYPKKDLQEAREKYPELRLYFKFDTHWNYMGGYFGSIPLLEALGVDTVSFSEINYVQVNEPIFAWNGYDLSNMLGLSDVLDEDINYHLYDYSPNEVRYEGDASHNLDDFDNAIRTFSTANDNRKIFLARDSFGESITPYIASSFSEVYSVNKKTLSRSQIMDEKPDVFIYEAVERSSFEGIFNYQNWNE